MNDIDIDKIERLAALIEAVNDTRTYEALVKLLEMRCLMLRTTSTFTIEASDDKPSD
jgi:hypothetical protein